MENDNNEKEPVFRHFLAPSTGVKDLLKPPSILTLGGTYFCFTDPEAFQWQITSIAHALSRQCRFVGNVLDFYSVAQHSVIVSYLVPEHMAFWALMHDAAESVMGDMTSPLKSLCPDYKAIEHRVEAALAKYYDLPFPMPPEIKHADLVALSTEKRDVLPTPIELQDWTSTENKQPMPDIIRQMYPNEARSLFLDRFIALCPERRIQVERQRILTDMRTNPGA